MEFVIIDISKSSVVCEWIREEALARISSVEMVDLPLSELQQMIEDEFEEGGFHILLYAFNTDEFIFKVAPTRSFRCQKWKVPLFVQRSTAHYQLPGQASVAFKDSVCLSVTHRGFLARCESLRCLRPAC
ncbi:hypothetical protein TELCIR_01634 [Teladorsagia circumcincta]|uniref:Uncharacterized protein n=1 Tax=Teladorsagia circumcincta TaxID=45464 RepID=A0A2G9V1E3_TELCI|nr:hypothetical protein TELCIR_01634 [Teladorsagia circumcincta]